MMSNQPAFTLYGNFHWPPYPYKGTQNTCDSSTCSSGCVIVRFISDGNGGYRTWIGWIPKNEIINGFDRFVPSQNDLKFSELNDTSFSERNKFIGIEIDSLARKETLRFSGAFYLDIFNQQGKVKLRWPLVEKYKFGQRNSFFYSGITVNKISEKSALYPKGENQFKAFTLDLAIPVPIPQTLHEMPGRVFHNNPVFPFRASFNLSGNAISRANDVVSLSMGGWPETNRRSSSRDSYEWPVELDHSSRKLGDFGFSAKQIPGQTKFAYLREKWSRQGVNRRGYVVDRRLWWPSNPNTNSSLVPQILEQLGLRLTNEIDNEFLLTSRKLQPEDYLLDLSVTDSDINSSSPSFNTRFRYRYTQYTNKDYLIPDQNSDEWLDDDSDVSIYQRKDGLKAFALAMRNELGGWLETESEKISINYSLSFTYSDINPSTVIDSSGNRVHPKPEIKAKISWAQPYPDDLGELSLQTKLSNRRFRFGGLNELFHSTCTGQFAVERLESNRPWSFLPKFSKPVQVNDDVQFELTPRPVEKLDFDDRGFLVSDKESKDWEVSPPLSPTAPRFYLALPKTEKIPVNSAFPSFSFNEESVKWLALMLTHDAPDNPWQESAGFATFGIMEREDQGKIFGRLGALEFSDVSHFKNVDTSNSSQITIFRYHSYLDDCNEIFATPGSVGIHLILSLKIESVNPISTDHPRCGDLRNSSPLLIKLGKGATTNRESGNFYLRVDESIGTGEDRRLLANLFETDLADSGPDSISYVVISEEPFGIARFSRKPLTQIGGLDSAEVAIFDSCDGIWKLKKTGETYKYSLPAQVIGDGMDKPRRHEIHDLEQQAVDNALAPYPMDIEKGTYLVDFKLPPSSELWVKPSDLERNFILPEWAIHEVFNQKNDFGLGAALEGFRGEFLYGMAVGIDVARETGTSRNARVAEIEAITGRIASRYFTSNPHLPLQKRWDVLQHALRRRPQRLEFWTQEPRNHEPFQPVNFSRGVSYVLRNTALHKPPLKPPKLVVSENQDYPAPVEKKPGSPRYHDRGLPGGALWPLESWAFFERLLEDPYSSAGTIEKIALTPIGGDADQTAEFLGGKVKIISETHNGLVQKLRVEILGRVAVFWHRAKHVVIYRRTVNATAQFAPEDNGKTRTRRTVLRKVEEFVEIMQPLRRYPDQEGAAARTVGFLDSVRFNSTIIPVDSAWSEDVVGPDKKSFVGWKIPLWNRYSAKIRPQVYPKPDVTFTTIAEGQGNRPLINQECLNPENIYFYADADDKNNPDIANSDSWKAREGIDACNSNGVFPGTVLKIQKDLKNEAVNKKKSEQSKMWPGVTRVLPSFRRFTWRLSTSGGKSLLNAERGQKPIYAGLESITFMRGVNTKEIKKIPEESIKNLIKVTQELNATNYRMPYWEPNGRGVHGFEDKAGRSIGFILDEFKKLLEGDGSKAEELFENLKSAVGNDKNGFDTRVDLLIKNFGSANKTKELSEIYKAAKNQVSNLKDLSEFIGGYSLKLVPNASMGDILDKGCLLVVVASVNNKLRIRIFDASRKRIVNKGENDLIRGKDLEELKKLLTPFPDENSLTDELQKQIIKLAASSADVDHKTIRKEDALCGSKKIGDQLIGRIRRKARLLSEEIRASLAEIDGKIETGELFPTVVSKEAFKNELEKIIQEKIQSVLDGPRADVGGLNDGIETIRSIVLDIESDINQAINRGLQRFESASRAFDRTKPWSESRFETFQNKVGEDFNRIAFDVNTALTEARQRISTELSEGSQKLATMAASIVAQVVEERTKGIAALDTTSFQLQQFVSSLISSGNRFFNLDTNTGIYLDILESLNKIETTKPDLANLIKEVKKPLEELKNDLPKIQKKIVTESRNIDGRIVAFRKMLSSNIDDVNNGINNKTNIILGKISELRESLESNDQKLEIDNLRYKFEDGFYKIYSGYFEELRTSSIVNFVEKLHETTVININETAQGTTSISGDIFRSINLVVEELQNRLGGVQYVLDEQLPKFLMDKAIIPKLNDALDPLPDSLFNDIRNNRKRVFSAFDKTAGDVEIILGKFNAPFNFLNNKLEGLCKISEQYQLSKIKDQLEKKADDYIEDFKEQLKNQFDESDFEELGEQIKDWQANFDDAQEKIRAFENGIKSAFNSASETIENARAFGDRLLDRVSNITNGNLASTPNNLLKLYSAATSAPEIANLQTNVSRLRATFDDLKEEIDTSKAKVVFAKLGDALKSIGLDLPFDKLSSNFQFDKSELNKLDLGQLFKSFGGLNLEQLFEGVKAPDNLGDYVQVSHDFDKKQARAWVQITVDLPLPGRVRLFELGPVIAYLKSPYLSGFVRYDVSKDTERVQEMGDAQIGTAIEIIVAGQDIVTLEKVELSFNQQGGMEFDFDPSHIKVNKLMKMVQDTLGSLFPDEFGGLTFIKQHGVPIGIEHLFSMPPMSLNFGTSGVSNIAISNRFRLIAFPDFMLSDRFNLSSEEQPFIFSIFIIGGTGFVQCETQYRPFDKSLSVAVKMAAGGSAALAFAVGPVVGGVYITLSLTLSYRKMIGRSGGGVTVGALLVIGGGVSLWGMVHVFLVITLSMSYRPNGQVDADGSLKAEVRVCRWVKLKFRGSVNYKLRNGKATTTSSSSTSVEAGPKLKKLKQKADRLKRAIG